MRDQLGLPLEYDPLKHGYRYTQAVHEFSMLHLCRHDLSALFLARHALEPLRGTRLERMLTKNFSKISGACPGEISIIPNKMRWAHFVGNSPTRIAFIATVISHGVFATSALQAMAQQGQSACALCRLVRVPALSA